MELLALEHAHFECHRRRNSKSFDGISIGSISHWVAAEQVRGLKRLLEVLAGDRRRPHPASGLSLGVKILGTVCQVLPFDPSTLHGT